MGSSCYVYVKSLEVDTVLAQGLATLYYTNGFPVQYDHIETISINFPAGTTYFTTNTTTYGAELPRIQYNYMTDATYDASPFCPPIWCFSWKVFSQVSMQMQFFTQQNKYWNQNIPWNVASGLYYMQYNYNGIQNPQGTAVQLDASVCDTVYERTIKPNTCYFGDKPGSQYFIMRLTPSGQEYYGMAPPTVMGGMTMTFYMAEAWLRAKLYYVTRAFPRSGVLGNNTVTFDAPIPSTVGGSS